MTAPDPVLQTTLATKLRDDSFEFRIPTLHDEIRIGERIWKLRAAINPDWDGFSQGLDGATLYNLRACATIELFLQKSSATWPFSADAKGAVIVDSSKWPADKAIDALEIYAGFSDELSKFRTGANAAPAGKPAGDETLAGQPAS